MQRTIACLRLLAVVLLASRAAAQNTWVVDDDGPADFAVLWYAANQAADGDVLLVRAGLYEGFAIEGKSLTIQAEGAVSILTLWPGSTAIKVRNLQLDQSVHIRGLQGAGTGGLVIDTPAVDLADNAGAVFLEDCDFDGTAALIPGGPAVRAKNCASVTFARCELVAPYTPASAPPSGNPWFAIDATDSRVFLYDCAVRGGAGMDLSVGASSDGPIAGSAAVRLRGSTLYASGGAIAGGDGGSDLAGFCKPGQDGAPGLVLEPSASVPTSVAILFGTTLSGGAGGAGGCGLPDGLDAPASQVAAGAVHVVPGVAPAFRADSPVDAGAVGSLRFEGQPGDIVFLLAGATAGVAVPASGLLGVLQTAGASSTLLALGALPPSGVLDLAVAMPALSPPAESLRLVGQALFVGPSGVSDGGVSLLLITDPAL